MPRPSSLPFAGHFTTWVYGAPRALGTIYDPAKVAAIAADPLSVAVLDAYTSLAAGGTLPVGPRGIGYVLLGSTVGGRLVIKDKAKQPGLPPKGSPARRAALAAFYDFADIGDTITALRRCGLLNWAWVADGRTDAHRPLIALDAAFACRRLKATAARFRPDILADQDVYLEVWCEAADLALAVANMMAPYGIAVFSGSGDIPVGAVRDAAGRYVTALKDGDEPHVLIIGDYDIDGRGNADRFYEDASAYVDEAGQDPDDVTWHWVAPDAGHLVRFPDLLLAAGPAVSKPDGRSLPFTLQAEALVRDGVLNTVLTEAVEALLDMDQVDLTRTTWDDDEKPRLLAGLDELAADLEEGDRDNPV